MSLWLMSSKVRGNRASLAVQWLELRTSTARGAGSISDPGTRIPHASGAAKKKKKKK